MITIDTLADPNCDLYKLTLNQKLNLINDSDGLLIDLLEGMTIDELHLHGLHNLTHLPPNLTVNQTLDLEGCEPIRTLPQDLSVGGSVDLRSCRFLTSLPSTWTTINGLLDLSKCQNLSRLPDQLAVYGYCDLTGCCSLAKLPKQFYVRGLLYINSNQFHPDELQKVECIKGINTVYRNMWVRSSVG